MDTKRIFWVGLVAVCTAMCSYAQPTGKNWVKHVDALISRHALKQSPAYHPVFGYIRPLPVVAQSKLKPITSFEATPAPGFYEARLVQVAPLVQPVTQWHASPAFVRFELLLPAQLTQAFYLWRLGHTHEYPLMDGYYRFLQDQAQKVYQAGMSYNAQNSGLVQADQLPNLQFLKRLMNPHITPSSYTELYETTDVYPKHIMLNGYGFPVRTAQAAQARIMDNYLMLSNPRAMSAFNNTVWWNAPDHGYTPFVLTDEEHAAADKLLALRQEGEKLPAHPTVRKVLELAYNRLETHSIPYSQVDEIGPGYKAYPNYKNTYLYQVIKEMLQGKIPLENYHYPGYYFLENVDITHLIVLDAVMGGVDTDNLDEVRRALNAFDKLCADVHPDAKKAVAHLTVLQKNLRIVFDELLHFNDSQTGRVTSKGPQQRKAELARYVSLVLKRPVSRLIGRNWKQSY